MDYPWLRKVRFEGDPGIVPTSINGAYRSQEIASRAELRFTDQRCTAFDRGELL